MHKDRDDEDLVNVVDFKQASLKKSKDNGKVFAIQGKKSSMPLYLNSAFGQKSSMMTSKSTAGANRKTMNATLQSIGRNKHQSKNDLDHLTADYNNDSQVLIGERDSLNTTGGGAQLTQDSARIIRRVYNKSPIVDDYLVKFLKWSKDSADKVESRLRELQSKRSMSVA